VSCLASESVGVPPQVAEVMAWTRADSIEAYMSVMIEASDWIVFSTLFLLSLIVGGGICALRKRSWWWPFSGAVCSMIAGALISGLLALPGLLAVIFLAVRKGEFRKPPPSEDDLVED